MTHDSGVDGPESKVGPGAREPAVDGEPGRGAPEEQDPGSGRRHRRVYHCDLCGHAMLDLHCKLICRRCGYKRDCSDP